MAQNNKQFTNLIKLNFSLKDAYVSPSINITEQIILDFLDANIQTGEIACHISNGSVACEELLPQMIADPTLPFEFPEIEALTTLDPTASGEGSGLLGEGFGKINIITSGQTGFDSDIARFWTNQLQFANINFFAQNLTTLNALPLAIAIIDDDFAAVNESALENGSGYGNRQVFGNILANDIILTSANIIKVTSTQNNDNYSIPNSDGIIIIDSSYGNLIIYTKNYMEFSAGDFIYTLNSPIFDKANQSEYDKFIYTLQDSNNNVSSAFLKIEIIDDVPTANSDFAGFDESDIPINQTASVIISGNILANDLKGADNAIIKSVNGKPSVGGVISFFDGDTKLTIYTTDLAAQIAGGDSAGYYTYEVYNKNILHFESDIYSLDYNYILQDLDGDSTSAVFNIQVIDAEPDATNDSNEIIEANYESNSMPVIFGNVLANDFLGIDNTKIISVNGFIEQLDEFNQPLGYIEITTEFGLLQLFTSEAAAILAGREAVGDYIYTYKNTTYSEDIIENFTYRLQDADNDESSATLSITIIDDEPSLNSFFSQINEQEYAEQIDNNIEINGSLNFRAGFDGLNDVRINNISVEEGVPFSLSPELYELIITDFTTGEFSFLLKTNTNQGINDIFDFTITLEDGDLDTTSEQFLIEVLDSEPEITDFSASLDEGSTSSIEDLVINDFLNYQTFGDGFNRLLINGITVVEGEAFTLNEMLYELTIINLATGEFEFKLKSNTLDDVNDVFEFEITVVDNDEDMASATFSVDVIDSTPIINDFSAIIYEEDFDSQEILVVNDFLDYQTFIDPLDRFELNGNILVEGEPFSLDSENWEFTIIDFATGEFEFKLLQPQNVAGESFNIDFELSVFDIDNDSATGSFSFSIINDVVDAVDDGSALHNPNINLYMIVDLSGTNFFDTESNGLMRLDNLKAALNDYVERYENLGVNLKATLIPFAGDSKVINFAINDFAALQSEINGLEVDLLGTDIGTFTDYDDALLTAQSLLENDLNDIGLTGFEHKVLFVADGEPNHNFGVLGIGADNDPFPFNQYEDMVPPTWLPFVTANDIDVIRVNSVRAGDATVDAALALVGDDDDPLINIQELNTIDASNLASPMVVSGNLLLNDNLSVDVPNYIESIAVDFISEQQASDFVLSQADINIESDGKFVIFNFIDQFAEFSFTTPLNTEISISANGDYTLTGLDFPYTVDGLSEVIKYTLIDSDADNDTAALRVFLSPLMAFDNYNFISVADPQTDITFGNLISDPNVLGFSNDPKSLPDLATTNLSITSIKNIMNGVEFVIPENGSVVITTYNGNFLDISSDGTYAYIANDPIETDAIFDIFEYTVTDTLGNTNSALLVIDTYGDNLSLPEAIQAGGYLGDYLDASEYTIDGNVYFVGGMGDDTLIGGSAKDLLFGNEDNDTLIGNADDDILLGGSGNDYIEGNAGNDRLVGNDGDDILIGGIGDDFLAPDNEFVTASALDLVQENQMLTDPTLILQPTNNDNNILTGGEGSDTFYFNLSLSSENIYTITDFRFNDTNDNLVFDGVGTENFTDVVISFEQDDFDNDTTTDLKINLSNDSILYLNGIDAGLSMGATVSDLETYLNSVSNIDIN